MNNMTKEDARQIITFWLVSISSKGAIGERGYIEGWFDENDEEAFRMAIEALTAELVHGEWIPVKWHKITDEEREREGYPKDWVVHIDCEMPCDEQEILVQTKSGEIRWDVCYEDGEYSLDSGWDWIDDIVAWRQLPEPYKEVRMND